MRSPSWATNAATAPAKRSVSAGCCVAGALACEVLGGREEVEVDEVAFVVAEDALHDGEGVGVLLHDAVGLLAETEPDHRQGEAGVAFGFDAAGDAFDDEAALELGERAEYLQEQPPQGAGGVDGFGGGGERDVVAVEELDGGEEVGEAT